MGNMFGKNVFRKSYASEMKETVCNKFRKNISERMAAPIKENHLERMPQQDTISFDK
ncbi:MAG: hypothetical protein KHX03_04360 [Clostridium sp.]|nr:hypothetical protein [Clostridium sp.]